MSVTTPHLVFLLSAFLPPVDAFVSRPFFHLAPAFSLLFVAVVCLKPTHISQCLDPQNSTPTSLLPCLLLCSLLPSIHLFTSPHSLSLSLPLSLSLVYPCCGLSLPSLSELLSLLSAPLARTKSSSAHSTTKDTREIKRKSLSQKKKKEVERRKN